MKTKRVSKLLAVLAMGLTLASCGKDNKAGNVNAYSNGFSNLNPNAASGVANLRQQRPCAYGQATNFTYTVSGQMHPQYVGKTFVGVQQSQQYPDIVVVQVSASQATYQLSMCPFANGTPIRIAGQPELNNIKPDLSGAAGFMCFQDSQMPPQPNYYCYGQHASAFTGAGIF